MAVSPELALTRQVERKALDDSSEHSIPQSELVRLAEHLKRLHRLSASCYESLDLAFEDHLKTGSLLFGLPIGVILEIEEDVAVIRAARGTPELHAGSRLPLKAAADSASLAPNLGLKTHISAPILVGKGVFGELIFGSYSADTALSLSATEKEFAEMLARSLGRFIFDFQVQDERKNRESLEKSRNRVLEMVTENQSQDTVLREVALMVETQRPGVLCSLLLVKVDMLVCASAPSFPSDLIRIFKPVRALQDASDLFGAELARSTLFWEDLRHCPIWAERTHWAAQVGIHACMTTPIVCPAGELLGVVALHYRHGQAVGANDRDLSQLASRLSALAIEQRRLHDRLIFQARHDSLTGLPNRHYFMELLEAAVLEARERCGTLAVLFIDLDRFKQINDTLGHAMGDRLLKEVGGRLRRLLTEDDLAGRMGGDEFTIVLTRQPDERSAMQASQDFLQAFRAPHRIDGNELFVTASIGVALFPKQGANASELLRHADLAMYHAKNSGKNEVEVFLAADYGSGLERLRLENALRRALENKEFELLYQPLVNLDGKVEGLEALLTWRHPVYGTISPKQFIPIAEETGLIIEIGTWVMREACLESARWDAAGFPNTSVSVNVSALQFERRDFVDAVADALANSGLPPRSLELELTESYVMRDLPQSVPRMSQIRALGVSIAIDDFGTGYSSLSYLNKLPVDSLKIDQSFLRSLQEPEGSLPVVQTIVRLAHSMNLTVVAEGVETRAELDLVKVLGCDRVQGHVYGPALRGEQVVALLARNAGEAMRAR
jgi:diguanylate cyclase (GGDEF)-like protein